MKIVKSIVAVAGVGALVAGGVYLWMVYLDNARLLAAANASKSGNLFNDPMQNIFLVAGLALAGGLALGVGLAMPMMTRAAVRRQVLDGVNDQRRTAIAKGAAQRASLPTDELPPSGTDPQLPPPDGERA